MGNEAGTIGPVLAVVDERGVALSFVGLVVFFLIGASLLPFSMELGAAFILLAVLLIGGSLVVRVRRGRVARLLREEVVRGGRGLCLEPGLVVLLHEVRYCGRTRCDRVEGRFLPLASPVCGDPGAALREAARRDGFAALRRGGFTYVAAPGARVVGGCCRGAALLYVTPGPWKGRARVALEAEEGYGEAEVWVEAGRYSARLVYMPGSGGGARGARLEVEAEILGVSRGLLGGKYRVREVLLEAREPGTHEAVYDSLPRPGTVLALAGVRGSYAPLVARLLGLPEGVTGYDPATIIYTARLVLDLPLRRDRVAEQPIQPVEPEGQQEA